MTDGAPPPELTPEQRANLKALMRYLRGWGCHIPPRKTEED